MNIDPVYNDEVMKRWGNTEAFKQSQERVGKLSKADIKRITTEGEQITQDVADLMNQGFAATDTKVQRVIGQYYQHLHHFYDPNYEMFQALGQIYVDDPRFAAVYEARAKGLAHFMRDAMAAYAMAHVS